VHCDVRSDNLCLRDGRAVFIDWNHACIGNALVDIAGWLPSLQADGGPAPDDVSGPEMTEIAAFLAGYWAYSAGQPPVPDAPRVRPLQLRQLKTALPWALRALGLPPLDLSL
jgi:thiamine kinase-like enzyme